MCHVVDTEVVSRGAVSQDALVVACNPAIGLILTCTLPRLSVVDSAVSFRGTSLPKDRPLYCPVMLQSGAFLARPWCLGCSTAPILAASQDPGGIGASMNPQVRSFAKPTILPVICFFGIQARE